MKVTLEIHLEGNLVLPVTHEVATLGDVAKLGSKLAAMPVGARRLMPIVAGLAVTTIDAKIGASDKNGASRRARRGKSTKRRSAQQESAAAASS